MTSRRRLATPPVLAVATGALVAVTTLASAGLVLSGTLGTPDETAPLPRPLSLPFERTPVLLPPLGPAIGPLAAGSRPRRSRPPTGSSTQLTGSTGRRVDGSVAVPRPEVVQVGPVAAVQGPAVRRPQQPPAAPNTPVGPSQPPVPPAITAPPPAARPPAAEPPSGQAPAAPPPAEPSAGQTPAARQPPAAALPPNVEGPAVAAASGRAPSEPSSEAPSGAAPVPAVVTDVAARSSNANTTSGQAKAGGKAGPIKAKIKLAEGRDGPEPKQAKTKTKTKTKTDQPKNEHETETGPGQDDHASTPAHATSKRPAAPPANDCSSG